MRQICDEDLVHNYLQRCRIDTFFQTENLPFQLWEYAPGEMMNVLHRSEDYLKFVVEGSFRIYAVRSDGSWHHMVTCRNELVLLGDLEFCGYRDESHFHEVEQSVRTIELHLKGIREKLLNDNRFLRYMLHVQAEKIVAKSGISDADSLEEALLYHMRVTCRDKQITSVTDTAIQLNYSRAQLQRVLRDLTARGILIKEGKGIYRLKESTQ